MDGAGAPGDAPAAAGRLDGLAAAVTGGNRGIGLGIARALGRAGASVALWARDAERGAEAVAGLEQEGVAALFVRCDVTVEDDVAAAAERTVTALGRLDACVANAGGSRHDDFLSTGLDRWERQLRLNLTSAFLTFREAARQMVAGGRGGALVAVSSCSALHASPRMPAYAAAKAGLGALVRSVAAELAPQRIRCNVLMPGWTANSTMSTATVPEWLATETVSSIPAGRWGTPEDLGNAAVFLCDPRLSYHTGTELRVDGGYSVMAPYLAVRESRRAPGGAGGAGA